MPETNNSLPHSPPAQYRSIYRAGLFDGQVIVITGAGSGMGRCTAHELASLGAQVVLVGRTLDKLQTVAQEIAQAQGKAACYVADIRDEERVKAVVGEIVARFGRIDGLVNNAGGQFPSPLHGRACCRLPKPWRWNGHPSARMQWPPASSPLAAWTNIRPS